MLRQSTFPSRRVGFLLLALCITGAFLATPGLAVQPEGPSAPTETVIEDNITTNTTWTLANSPYYVKKDIYVEPGVTLTIEPGVEVELGKDVKILVGRDGIGGASVIAKGTPDQQIQFTRRETTYRWKYIRHSAGSSSYYRYVKFHWGGADEAILSYVDSGTHVINNCEIKYAKRQGIVAVGDGVDLTIAGTLISKNSRYGILTHSGATLNITGSEFNHEDSIAIYLRWGSPSSIITVNNSSLLTREDTFAVYADSFGGVRCINVRNNWWGAANGPLDEQPGSDACGAGKTNNGDGSEVSYSVDYSNWLTSKPARTGITTPPVAAFTVSPDPSTPLSPSTDFEFDASGSTDVEDYTSSLEFCWDWENTGTCTTWLTSPTTNHQFTTGGPKTVRLVVRDTDGDTDEATKDIQLGYPPTATFTFTQPTWAQVDFDASASSDVETTDKSQLQAYWDWEGNGLWDTTAVSVTAVQTHTYPHLGRYWPTLMVKDTDNLTSTVSKAVNIIPPAVFTNVTGSGGTLISTDATVQVDLYTDTVTGDVISNGLVITHTPWLTLPHNGPDGLFTYQGFNLAAESPADGQPITEVNGTYTITVHYDYTYLTDVADLPPFENKLMLHWWSGTAWVPVAFTLDTANDQLVATVDSFGDFALVMDARRAYLPLVMK